MKKTIILSALFALITLNGAFADETLEQRVTALENDALSIPSGVFLNGEFEMRYDPETIDSDIDSRAEFILGLENEIDNEIINWGGASARFDSYYALDRTKDNTIVEKQMGIGTGLGRIYFGETDAQRLGFAKTSKISVPLIITESQSRIDHNEKVVLTFGGWDNNNEFDFDTYRLSRDLPIGGVIGYDAESETAYVGATASVMGYFDVSYMQIGNKDNVTKSGNNQQGYSIGGSTHRWGVPMIWGVEVWDDKNTGTYTKDNRLDYGVLYSVTDELAVSYHRLENDDLGFDGNHYGAVYTVDAGHGNKLEMGVYLHDREQTNIGTGAKTVADDNILATVKYKF